ncbi:unnamed protein product [Hanseniaspora opuntiae]
MNQNNYSNLHSNMGNSSASLSNSNLDFSHNNNSRSNSYKRVTKPTTINSSINSTLDRSKFDALSRDTRSNTYHFGNTNGNMNTRTTDFPSYLNIYDDEDEDDVADTFNYNENQNNNRNFTSQFMDSQQIKFANFNNDNENNEFKMKLDSIQDNRANTISKQYNTAKSSLDNMMLNDDNMNSNFIYQSSIDNMNNFDVNNYMRMSDGNILSNLGFGTNEPSKNSNVPVKVEQFQDTSLANDLATTMNKKDTNNSNESISTTPVNKVQSEGKKKKPKMSHNIIEQKYRDNINDKILQFKNIVPTLQMCCLREDYLKDFSSNEVEYGNTNNYLDGMVTDPKLMKRLDGLEPAKKLSKAIILSKSYEYIEHLEKKVEQLEEKLSKYERMLQGDNNASGRQGNFEGRIMQTPLSSLNQMKASHTISKSNSSGSYYMPEQIPKPPQEIKGPSHALYQSNVQGGQPNMNTHGSALSSQSLSNSNDLSNSSMQSLNQFADYMDILGYQMKNNNSATNDTGSVVDYKRMQSPLSNMENSNAGRRGNVNNASDIHNYSYLEK